MDAPQTADAVERSTEAETSISDETSRGSRRTLGLILLATVAAFWPTVASFPSTWNGLYQEHGFFVGGLVVWLIWRDRHRVVAAAGDSVPDLLPVIGLLSIAWLFAVVMNVQLLHQLLFWSIATLGALAIFGWRARIPILVTATTFLLALPFWGVLAPVLQRATTVASGAMATMAGIQAEIGENHISLSSGTFLVEEGCSGINYLMGGLVLGAFYGHLFTSRWQAKLKIVAVAGVMSIVGNWIRVAALVFLGEATAMQSPYLDDHLWQGWAIFTLLMVPTYLIARRIERRDAAKEPAEPAGPDNPGGVSATVLRRRAVHTCMVAVTGPVLFFVLGPIPRGDAVDREAGILGADAAWATEVRPSTDGVWTPDFHGFDQRADWTLTGGEQPVHAARYYFLDQRQGEELIQDGNRIAPDSLVAAQRIVGPVGPQRRFVREAILRDARTPRVVWYWYRVAELDTPWEIKAKLLEILAFFRRTPAAELVVLDAECAPGDCTGAAMALRSAMGVPTEPR